MWLRPYIRIVFRRLIRYIQVRPTLDFWEVKYAYESRTPFSEISIVNDRLYRLVSKLTLLAYPLKENDFERWWIFYLPLKRKL